MSAMDRFGFDAASTGRVPLTASVRAAVLQAWGTCGYCSSGVAEHVDHIVPRAKGGPDRLDNFAAACMRCNLMKSDIELPETFLALLVGKARRKAPKIAERLRPRPVADRSAERDHLLSELADLQARELADLDERAPVPAPAHARALAEIEDGFSSATVTTIKKVVAAARSRLRAAAKTREIEAIFDQVVSLRRDDHSCPTVALLLAERDRSKGRFSNLAEARRHLRRVANQAPRKRRTHDGVELNMAPEVRRAFLERLADLDPADDSFRFSAEGDPQITDYLLNVGRWPVAWIGGATINLLGGGEIRGDRGKFCFHPELPTALRHAEDLGADAFAFRNKFGIDRLAPLSHCLAQHPRTTLPSPG